MQGICVALGEDSNVKYVYKDRGNPAAGKIQDFWEYSKKNLLNNKLIGRIQSYSVEKIKKMSQASIAKLEKLQVFFLLRPSLTSKRKKLSRFPSQLPI
jgi:dynein heavy chain, axonemal